MGSKNIEVIKMHTYKINEKQYFSISPRSKKKVIKSDMLWKTDCIMSQKVPIDNSEFTSWIILGIEVGPIIGAIWQSHLD